MARHITIYGPLPTQKFSARFQNRFVEMRLSYVEKYFDLEGVPLSLKPLSLSHGHMNIEVVQLSNDKQGFLLDADVHQFYKVFIDIPMHNSSNFVGFFLGRNTLLDLECL